MPKTFILISCALLITFSTTAFAGELVNDSGKQTIIPSRQSSTNKQTPLVVIYTLSTCPHCMEAKEYLKNNKIPFINREVDTNEEHMKALMDIFDSMGIPEQKRGVPLFIIGDKIKIQGFSIEKVQNALKEVTAEPVTPQVTR